jgi:LPXTG-site transpeptidase (sortase) family protein
MPVILRRCGYAVSVLLACALLAAAGPALAARHPAPRHPAARHPAARHPAARHAKAAEWRIAISSIGVHARLVTLGNLRGDVLPLPTLAQAQDAGWYPFTAAPGAAGNAVVVGHVDTYVGSAVFYNLYQLRRGDLIDVWPGAAEQRFRVTSVREVSKDRFPVSQVFGSTEKHLLWLITCGGDFDYLTGHYMDNIIVSAAWQPVNTRKPPRVCNNRCRRKSMTFRRGKK